MKCAISIHSVIIIFTLIYLGLGSRGQAQISQTWDGGDGVWDLQHTPDWDNGANTWHGGDDDALINTGGTLTVVDTYNQTLHQVTVDSIQVSAASGTTITGDSIEDNPFLQQNYEAPAGTDFSSAAAGTRYGSESDFIVNQGGAGALVVQSQIELSDLGENQQTTVYNASSHDLQLNNIDFGAYTLHPAYNNSAGYIPDRRLNFYVEGPAGSSGTLNGAVTASAAYGYGQTNFTGNNSSTAAGASVMNITTNADFSGLRTVNLTIITAASGTCRTRPSSLATRFLLPMRTHSTKSTSSVRKQLPPVFTTAPKTAARGISMEFQITELSTSTRARRI